MLFLGIDPGFATTGFAVIEVDAKKFSQQEIKLLDFGVIKTAASVAFPTRLVEIENNLQEILNGFNITTAAVEKIYFAKNTKTAINVAQARGVLLATLAKHNITILEYTPMQVKKAITGSGGADKKMVHEMLKSLLHQQDESWQKIFQDDASDAVAIAICGYYQQRSLNTREVANC